MKALDVSTVTFPALSLSKGVVLVSHTSDELTTCGKGGLRNGWFDDLLVVDSRCQSWRVQGARKLHGVGPFWGYNIFLNQRIKVDLLVSEAPSTLDAPDVRTRVLKSFSQWRGWETEEGHEELRDSISKAQSVPEIISLLEPRPRGPAWRG